MAQRVQAGGGELWLLLDEVGAPLVASSPGAAEDLVILLKRTLETTTPHHARWVATGSGMVSLLKALADAPVNGFTLWGSLEHVCLGQEPAPALALAMAQRLHAAHAPAWPLPAQHFISPARLLASLARAAHGGGLTSPRPALLAFLAGRLGDASAGSAQAVLQRGVEDVLHRLSVGSRGDAAVGLGRMTLRERSALRELAMHGTLPKAYPLSRLAAVLCEEGGREGWGVAGAGAGAEAAEAGAAPPAPAPARWRLLPPYARLLEAWIRPDGELSIAPSSAAGSVPLVPRVTKTLGTLVDCRVDFEEDLLRSVSARVLLALAECGIGVSVPGSGGCVRTPGTLAEFSGIPAVQYMIAALDQAAESQPRRAARSAVQPQQKQPQLSSTVELLRRALAAEPQEQARFMAEAGFYTLQLLRNFCVHVPFDTSGVHAVGLTEAAVDGVVREAALEVAVRMGKSYRIDPHGAASPRPAITMSWDPPPHWPVLSS